MDRLLSAHGCRYGYSSCELVATKPVGLDNHVLANRDFTLICFVAFRLNAPSRSSHPVLTDSRCNDYHYDR